VITYLFIVHKQKQNRTNIKSRKIDKKKRKILVSKHTITLGLARTSKVEWMVLIHIRRDLGV